MTKVLGLFWLSAHHTFNSCVFLLYYFNYLQLWMKRRWSMGSCWQLSIGVGIWWDMILSSDFFVILWFIFRWNYLISHWTLAISALIDMSYYYLVIWSLLVLFAQSRGCLIYPPSHPGAPLESSRPLDLFNKDAQTETDSLALDLVCWGAWGDDGG